MGLTTSVSGNHSFRIGRSSVWITPSGVPRYLMRPNDLVRVDLRTGTAVGRKVPSIELELHRRIYNRCPGINSVIHTHSPYTIGVAISSQFTHVIEEAKIVVGTPAVIPNQPSGSEGLAESVAREFQAGARAVIVKNHGVVAGGKDMHHARAIAESLEEWAKILFAAKTFGGVKDYLGD